MSGEDEERPELYDEEALIEESFSPFHKEVGQSAMDRWPVGDLASRFSQHPLCLVDSLQDE